VAGEQPGVALRPRFPGCPRCEGGSLGHRSNRRLARTHRQRELESGHIGHRIGARMARWASWYARSLAMITVAAFAVLVLLPAAIAAQATVPV
jgi:transposase InsO family protein